MAKRKYIQPFCYNQPSIKIQWLSDKYSNFTKDKIYLATAQSKYIHSNLHSNFKITDDEGDNVSLDKRDINKKWKIID